VWDVKSGECCHELTGHVTTVNGIVYTQSGNQLISSSWDSLRIWDVATGICKYTLTGHSDIIFQIAYSPQNDQVASASNDTTIRVWDVGTGECRHILIGHNTELVHSVVYSPRGDQISSGARDGSLKVWDATSGDCLWTFTGHSSWITKIVYSSRWDIVVSAGDDKSVRVWDVTSGQCRAVIQDFRDRVTSIVWTESSGFDYLIAGCADGTVGAWQVLLEGDHCVVSLRWMPAMGVLDVMGATIQDVQGLGQLSKQLLKQRGAIGEPINRLREAGKKVAAMASVVSRLKALSNTTAGDIATIAGASTEPLEQRLERAKDPLFRDIVAAIVKNIDGCK
jgi:WD40 repeat protein